MSRKTINVADLIVKVNEILKNSTCSPDIRQGEINVLEYVLHNTGNYAGFRYLTQDEVPEGELPGDIDENDSTRIYFFFHRNLGK